MKMPGTLRFLLILAAIPFSGEAVAQGANKPIIPSPVIRPVPAPLPDTSRLILPRVEEEREAAEGKEDDTNATAGQEGGATQPSHVPETGISEPVRDRAGIRQKEMRAIRRAPIPPAKSDDSGTAGSGPQPEPPAIVTGATGRGTDFNEALLPSRGRRIPDHLRQAFDQEDLAAMRDLMEWLRGQRAIDPDALGGRAGRKPGEQLDWKERTGRDSERGPGVISRLQEERATIEPSVGRDGSDGRRRSSGRNTFVGPSARAGGVVSRGGRTSQDGASDGDNWSSCGQNCAETTVVDDDGTTTHHRMEIIPAPDNTADDGEAKNGTEGESLVYTQTTVVGPDGYGFQQTQVNGVDKRGNWWSGRVIDTATVIRSRTRGSGNDPSRQPADPQYGSSGEPFFFECFDPAAPCIRSDVQPEDTVSQPGVGDSESIQGSRPSVGERVRAVTQPVSDATGSGRTGGGSRPPDPCIAAGGCDDRRPGEP